jgi:hypothetical protein
MSNYIHCRDGKNTPLVARASVPYLSCTVTIFWLKFHPEYSGLPGCCAR